MNKKQWPYWLRKATEARKGKTIHEAKRTVARALVEAGMTYRDVAETLEIGVGSVHNILKEPPEDLAPIVREMNARLAQKAGMLADHLLSRINDDDINDADLKQKALAAAILMDKARMLMAERTDEGGARRSAEVEHGPQAEPPEIKEEPAQTGVAD